MITLKTASLRAACTMAATGNRYCSFPLQNAPDLGAGLMYCPERAYPRCAVMPCRP